MAQYLAKKLKAAESDPSLEPECAELILKLWSQRRDFPGGDPLERYDHILDAMEQLNSAAPRYFRGYDTQKLQDDRPESKWLSEAIKLDRTASYLISHLLKLAAKESSEHDEDKELLELAGVASIDLQIEFLQSFKLLGITPSSVETGPDPIVEKINELKTILEKIPKSSKAPV